MSTTFDLRGSPSSADQFSGSQSLGNNLGSTVNWFGVREALLKNTSQDVTQRLSNLGSANPNKGPTARSLFYNAANLNGEDAKYGQFLFYSFTNNNNDFIQEYYVSERSEFNSRISSVASRNPSAGKLVRETQTNIESIGGNITNFATNTGNNTTGNKSYIIGGASAPYYWRDFLYCKYYGAIPNNYMITLRRFPAPMRDNMSIPEQLKTSDLYKKSGAGRPVAQAITWWGGQTGNSLNDAISFSTGLKWEPKTQKEILEQEGTDKGFNKSILGRALGAVSQAGGFESILAAMGDVANIVIASSDSGKAAITIPKINFALRDKASTGQGPLSDFIFNSVDTVDSMWIRGRGLKFSTDNLSLKFHYELTSLGEVNTKAALIDILGNLLSIGTNYGNFLTPDVRYDNGFPAIGFPGGDKGLERFYSDPLGFVKTAIKFLADPDKETMGNPTAESFRQFGEDFSKKSSELNSVLKQLSTDNLNAIVNDIDGAAANVLAFSISQDLIKSIQFSLGLKTGAPTGEWHLVVGNPMNPIAMIGNLICSDLDIKFSEVLGPDDFPTEIIATFTLQHGRDRERGEIESMFNRGDGRLYQSTLPTYASNQSLASLATVNGDNLPYQQNDTTQAVPFNEGGLGQPGFQPD